VTARAPVRHPYCYRACLEREAARIDGRPKPLCVYLRIGVSAHDFTNSGMSVELCFHGAAGTVTGSCIEVAHDGRKLLIDCGLFQGSRSLEALNHRRLPVTPAEIDGVLLTHAHLDHSGRLPALARHGLTAPIWCTAPTARLIDPMLLDAAELQHADVKRRNARPDRAGLPPFERLYDAADVKHLMRLVRAVPMRSWR